MSTKTKLIFCLLTLLLFQCEKDFSSISSKKPDIPIIKPPASKIVFVSERDGNPEIYTMDLDGQNQTRLTNNEGMDKIPQILPDGKKIVYFSEKDGDGGIWIMNIDGSEQKKLLHLSKPWFFFPFYISKDGNTIIHYSYNLQQLSIVNSDGSNPQHISNVSYDYNPVTFSRDGGKILFPCDIQNSGNYDIILMDLDSRNMMNLTPDSFPKYNESASFTPDEDTIIYIASDPSWEDDYIYKLNYKNGIPIRISDDLITNPFWPRYSDDGQKIIFSAQGIYNSDKSTRYDLHIFVMDKDGSNINMLSSINAYSYEAILLNTNMDIFYPTDWGIYKANLISLNEEQLCQFYLITNFNLSKNYIFFESYHEAYGIYRTEIDGTNLENLTDLEERNYSFSLFLNEEN